MSGFAGIFFRDGKEVTDSDLSPLLDSIAHRLVAAVLALGTAAVGSSLPGVAQLAVLDTLIVMKQRFSGEKTSLANRIGRVFTADRNHIHHILVSKYRSEGKAIFAIWLVTLLFATAAVMTAVQKLKWIGYGSAALALLLLIVMRYRRPTPA